MAAVLIPLGLVILMLAVGLETRLDAFRALARAPRAVAVGLILEVAGLPLVAAAVAQLFGLAPVHAVGLVLVAAAPAGVTSNFVTLMAGGDVALSVVLTVATSAIAPLVVPLALAAAFAVFADESVRVVLPFGPTFGAVALTTVAPLALAAIFAHRRPDAADRLRPFARRVSMVVFLAIVAAAIVAQGWALLPAIRDVGPAALAFDLAGLALFVAVARGARIDRVRLSALVMTGGLRNVAVALTVAVALLARPEVGAAATVYVVVMNAVALTWVAIVRRLPEIKDVR